MVKQTIDKWIVRDDRFLLFLKLAFGAIIVIFSVHTLSYKRSEVYPLTRLPMYSEAVSAPCEWFYTLAVDASGTIIFPAELYNQAENEKDYYIGAALIAEAALGSSTAERELLDRVSLRVPDGETISIYLYQWSGDIPTFRRQIQSRQPEEMIWIATIPGQPVTSYHVETHTQNCTAPFADEEYFR